MSEKNGESWLGNPFVVAVLRSVAVRIVGFLAAAIVGAGVMTSEQVAAIQDSGVTLILSALIAFATILYGIARNYTQRRKLLVAQNLPAGVTEREVEDVVKVLGAPSVLTSKDAVPKP